MHNLILIAALLADPEPSAELIRLRVEVASLKAQLSVLQATQAQDAPAVPESPTTPARFDILPGGKSADIPPPSSPAAASQAVPAGTEQPTLRQRIAAYRDSGGQRWYEEIGGRLSDTSKAHLNLEHKWTAADVHGLTKDELNLLHGASHTGRIVAGKTATIVAVSEPHEIIVYSPASFACPACNAWKSVSIPGVEIKHVRKDWSGWRSYPVVKVNGRHYYSPTVEQVKAMLR